MSIDARDELLFYVAQKRECLIRKGAASNTPYEELCQAGDLFGWKTEHFWWYALTTKGIARLLKRKVRAIQVTPAGQPPYTLRNAGEFMDDVRGGYIEDTFDCWLQDGFDGQELFTVSIVEIDLYTLANLPEWQPV